MYTWIRDARMYQLYRIDGELEMRVYLWAGEWIQEFRGT